MKLEGDFSCFFHQWQKTFGGKKIHKFSLSKTDGISDFPYTETHYLNGNVLIFTLLENPSVSNLIKISQMKMENAIDSNSSSRKMSANLLPLSCKY